ncbi:hydantoinase/oxoprolinase family protein [Aureimonas fodinaquatilis]|uniref:Hydantoinase/oxoprolinase family protein n=1 Tax=Aureimonas fodinaquatilis TaxID=2565783 RepID=A0A5B0E105_9HYPH|nr:hydantoinase/oxoprolinase family protein [Aureimonas fodinaquatilis]KAA0971982.1 hydantoinase/oxoprolinase family protein [Aureimonas fodinaquatilis]
MTNTLHYRLGIDIGGTFTDLAVVEEATGKTLTFKTPSVPSDPARAVFNGIVQLRDEYGIAPEQIRYFVHGTTLGLNTLLQRSGATTGLLVTRGFRDVLEIGRLRLPDPTNYYVERIKPLVARRHVREIDERLRVDGSVLEPINLDAATQAARDLMAQGVTSIAILLMHSYRNPEHEKLLADHLRRELPELYVCASHEVWPQQREYERGLLTTINAFIGHRMRTYFERLEDDMSKVGMRATVLTTKSNGGVMAAASAATSPVETLLSGPASGAMGALMTGTTSGNRKLIGFDMGGTSVDIAIIDGDMLYSTESRLGDFPLIMPAVDISSIGAGGGSIAWLDAAGILKVGPQSAGAMPGPASYGHGGDKPTVTDAYVKIGLYSPERRLGGGLRLDKARAEAALETLAKPLGMSTAAVAQSILDVTTANMYAQFMPLMARKGLDPRDFRLLAYGGAGPQHAFLLAQEVGVEAVMVPASPGTLCAQGSLAADFRQDFIRTMPGGHPDADALISGFAEITQEAQQWMDTQPVDIVERHIRLSADMRYHGQSFDLTIPVEGDQFEAARLPALINAFHTAYERIYGFSDQNGAIEITNVRVAVLGTTAKTPQIMLTEKVAPGTLATPREYLSITDNGVEVHAGFYERALLHSGHQIEGPAVIEAPDTTIYMPGGFTAEIDDHGNLIGRLRAKGEQA